MLYVYVFACTVFLVCVRTHVGGLFCVKCVWYVFGVGVWYGVLGYQQIRSTFVDQRLTSVLSFHHETSYQSQVDRFRYYSSLSYKPSKRLKCVFKVAKYILTFILIFNIF